MNEPESENPQSPSVQATPEVPVQPEPEVLTETETISGGTGGSPVIDEPANTGEPPVPPEMQMANSLPTEPVVLTDSIQTEPVPTAEETPESLQQALLASFDGMGLPSTEPAQGEFGEALKEHVTALAGAALSDQPMVETLTEAQAQRLMQRASQGLDLPLETPPPAIDLPPKELRAAVEALLFIANRPLTASRLTALLPGTQPDRLEGLFEGLSARYDHEQRGWQLKHLAGGWQLLTRESLHGWARQLDSKEPPQRLSKSALETLAVVAYKQPVTRGEIEDIRGVQCGPMLRSLLDLRLVQVLGRDEEALGRPIRYGTTEVFLDRFGLGSIGDLPRGHEMGI